MPLDAGLATLGAGVLDLGGSLATSALEVHETRQNRRFQRNMSNTAHQREVKDLIAAGLNPVLSANHGASTPGGDSANIPQLPSLSAKLLDRANVELLQSQKANVDADTSAKTLQNHANSEMYETDLLRRRLEYTNLLKDGDLKGAAYQTAQATLRKIEQELKNLQLAGTHSALGLAKARAESDYYKGAGKYAPTAGPVLRDVLNSAHGVRKYFEEHSSKVKNAFEDWTKPYKNLWDKAWGKKK